MKNPVTWLISYVRDSKSELQKVSWPSRDMTLRYSAFVIVLCLITATCFAGLDYVLNLGLQKLIELSA